MRSRALSLIVLLIIILPILIYRFRHPGQTETELFLNIFESYKEFFHAE